MILVLCFHSRSEIRISVLLILDRNIDLVPMMSHGWTYQALVSDCLEMKLNRVVVTQPQKRSYDLDSKDFFWAKHAANPFPQVAEDIDTELNRYKQDAAELTRSTGVSDVNDISQLSVLFPAAELNNNNIISAQGSLDKCCTSEDRYHSTARAHCAQGHTRHTYEHRHCSS